MALRDFNLLISTSRGNERNALSEAWFLLGEIGDREALVERTGISGLIVAKTVLDSFSVVEDFRRMLDERPGEFRYILRVIPIELVTRSSLDEIKNAVAKISSKILEKETFRITVEKRHSELSTKEIIREAASGIERKVDLENPDKIVLIEVLGGSTAVSIVSPNDVLSIVKEKPR